MLGDEGTGEAVFWRGILGVIERVMAWTLKEEAH